MKKSERIDAVAKLAVKNLQIIEELQLDESLSKHHSSIKKLSKSIIIIVQLCLSRITSILNEEASAKENDINVDVNECMIFLEKILQALKHKIPNHFGTFRPIAYIGELQVCDHELKNLLGELNEENETPNRYTNLDSTLVDIKGFFAKIWWHQKFGKFTQSVNKDVFVDSFIKTYHGQPAPALQCFLKKIVRVKNVNCEDQEVIHSSRYNYLSYKHGGLYEAYQAISNPSSLVFTMGIVEDETSIAYLLPVVVKGLLGFKVTQVCCGGQHAAVLIKSGEIYTWGKGGYGRLGHGDQKNVKNPKLVEALTKAKIPCVQVACGFAYTAAVTADNSIYTWGAGENGRLGHGDVMDKFLPTEIVQLRGKVKMVYAGSVHTCSLTTDGVAYSFGKFEYTGHNAATDILEPKKIMAFEGRPIESISVGPGGYHTIALSKEKRVYTWGHNRVGQLGYRNYGSVPKNSEGAFFQPVPQEVVSLRNKNINQVVAGWGHSAAVTKDGQLYVCGRNKQGQLGLGHPDNFPLNERGHPYLPYFKLVESLSDVKVAQIACGGEHSVVRSYNSSAIYSFGAGHQGQLGHGKGNNQSEFLPKLVEDLSKTGRKMLHIGCGNNCTLILAGEIIIPLLSELCLNIIHSDPELTEQLKQISSILNMKAANEYKPRYVSNQISDSSSEIHSEETSESDGSAVYR